MPQRTFTTKIDFDADPVVFTLDGERTSGMHAHWEETFTLLPEVPHGAVSKMLRMQTIDPKGRMGWDAEILTRFLVAVLDDESAVRFEMLTEDSDRIVTTRTIADVAMWIVADVGSRPTKRATGSVRSMSLVENGATDSSPSEVAAEVT